jgi:hypothetical protein
MVAVYFYIYADGEIGRHARLASGAAKKIMEFDLLSH